VQVFFEGHRVAESSGRIRPLELLKNSAREVLTRSLQEASQVHT
jgi:hypothetical protein